MYICTQAPAEELIKLFLKSYLRPSGTATGPRGFWVP